MKKLFVSQSNYIPWRGFFDSINYVDEYIIYDDMQFSKNSYRNRNKIMGPNGSLWLTIPLKTKGRFGQNVNQVEVVDDSWRLSHWRSIELSYRNAPHFSQYESTLKALYLERSESNLTAINHVFLSWVCEQLNIKTKISDSRSYKLEGDRNERLVSLCQQTKSKMYCSSPTAQIYLDEGLFRQHGLEVFFFDYTKYPPYEVGHKFEELSVLDLLFRFGPKAETLIFRH
jgi:hypothetical protein